MKKRVYGILLCFVFLGCACNSNFGTEKLPINFLETIESEIDSTKSSFQNKGDIESIKSVNYCI